MYIPQHMPFFQISQVYQGTDILYCAGVDMPRPANYRFHVYLVLNPKKGVLIQNDSYSRFAGH